MSRAAAAAATVPAPAAIPTPTLAVVPKRSLFALVREVEDLADLVDQLDRAGELTPDASGELEEMLWLAITGTKEKVDRSCAVLAAFEAAAAAAKAECARLADRAKKFTRDAERLETYLLAALDIANRDSIEGNTSGIARRKNPPKVVILDEKAIPEDFWRTPDPPPPPPPPPSVPDKKLIAAALKTDPAGVTGARLEQTYRLVRS